MTYVDLKIAKLGTMLSTYWWDTLYKGPRTCKVSKSAELDSKKENDFNSGGLAVVGWSCLPNIHKAALIMTETILIYHPVTSV